MTQDAKAIAELLAKFFGDLPAVREPKPAEEHCKYRTKDGRDDFAFRLKRMPDQSYRIYILSQPSYRGRDESLVKTHRYQDADGFYVCFTGTLRTPEEARAVAALWADSTQLYRRTGRFPLPQ